ncbi:MAG: class I SAM-dependent methyltransferase [Flavobacteriales bacterium]|nr:class I SAM-dependent methyltransferase [Flavobacteriales bacterium]
MKEPIDNFSEQSAGYLKFRPIYPNGLFQEVLSHVSERGLCWDCATGNGQIAAVLSEDFEEVYASDISSEQLEHAPKLTNIKYWKCRAEETPFNDNSFDLTIVGQAVHWFDHDHFNLEVRRVSKPRALVVLIGYGLMFADESFNSALTSFYEGTIGDYWDPKRKHIDSGYATIPFPFKEIELDRKFSIDVRWSLDQLQGYLGTWSSVRKFIRENDSDPVKPFIDELRSSGVWTSTEIKEVSFPLFVKIGRVIK